MRSFLVGAAFGAFAIASPATAQPAPQPGAQSPEVLAKVYACATIADSAERLACFDGAVAQMKTAETQGQFTAVDAAGVRQIEREAFGFSLPSLPRLTLPKMGGGGSASEPALTEALTMTIRSVGRMDGRTAFVMDNGQTWLQIDNEQNRFTKAGERVTIKRAAMGSYLMDPDRGGAAVRVRRAQ
jgi:hypothetical protein